MIQIGHLVCSVQGRDSGRFYLVVGIEGESRVLVADGEGRKVENPKRKNIKHLKIYGTVAGLVADKARNGRKITNADVRKELKSLVESL
ncbi:MAG: RNA-binding protein [Pelotomaculum sp.]|nr:RNA-binding protein [Pelotomaculum sp.]